MSVVIFGIQFAGDEIDFMNEIPDGELEIGITIRFHMNRHKKIKDT